MTTTTELHPVDPFDLAGSRYEDVHLTQAPELIGLLAAVPGYNDARKMFGLLAGFQPEEVDLPPDLDVQARHMILEALQRGDEPPGNLHELLVDPESLKRRAIAVRGAKFQAADAVRNTLDNLVPVSELRSTLSNALVNVCREASEMHRAGVPTTPEDAVSCDRVAEYRSGQTLESRYAETRRIQQAHFTPGVEINGEQIGLSFTWYVQDMETILDPNELLTVTAERDLGGFTSLVDLPENWKAGAALWWFASTGATPWIPTSDQCKDARIRAELSNGSAKKDLELQVPKTSRIPPAEVDRVIQQHQDIAYWDSQG